MHVFKVKARNFALPFFSNIEKDSKTEDDHLVNNTVSLIIVSNNEIVINGKQLTKFSDAVSYFRFEILDKIKVGCNLLVVVPKLESDKLAKQIS